MLNCTTSSFGGAMRRFATILSCMFIASQTYAAEDDWRTTVYVPAIDGQQAKTVNTETREENAVLEGILGNKPAACPPQAYWIAGEEELVNCASGSVYRLTDYTGPDKFPFRAFALVPSQKPKPGTNDPGEMDKPVTKPEKTP